MSHQVERYLLWEEGLKNGWNSKHIQQIQLYKTCLLGLSFTLLIKSIAMVHPVLYKLIEKWLYIIHKPMTLHAVRSFESTLNAFTTVQAAIYACVYHKNKQQDIITTARIKYLTLLANSYRTTTSPSLSSVKDRSTRAQWRRPVNLFSISLPNETTGIVMWWLFNQNVEAQTVI